MFLNRLICIGIFILIKKFVRFNEEKLFRWKLIWLVNSFWYYCIYIYFVFVLFINVILLNLNYSNLY